MNNSSTKNVVLGVGAHADDMDFTSSATIAKFVEDGWDAYYIVATDGSRGSDDPEMTHERLAEIRKSEQTAAGKILGIKEVFFLGHTDTQLVCDLQLKEKIVRIIRTVKPKIVITMDPTFTYATTNMWNDGSFINHTDHRAAAQATMDAVFPLARDRLTFPEHEKAGLRPHKVEELWLTCFEHKRHVVDVTSTFEKKLKALHAHSSQFEDFEKVKEGVTRRANHFAKGEPFQLAENFTRLKIS